MSLSPHIHVSIYRGNESGYVAECQEIAVITQGQTLDEVTANLSEAVALHLEDEDPQRFGLTAQPALHLKICETNRLFTKADSTIAELRCDDLIAASSSSLGFWDNEIDDAEWNNI
jgi:predicted RNase H-like HicB family nuclease